MYKTLNRTLSINVVYMWDTRSRYMLGDLHGATVFTHRKQHACTRVRIHRKMLRTDAILLMWGVAENVKFRVCSSSRFSNGAHARCRCVEWKRSEIGFLGLSRKLRGEVTVFPVLFHFSSVFPSISPRNHRRRYRQQTRENRDLFANNFAHHVSSNHHVQRRDNTNK